MLCVHVGVTFHLSLALFALSDAVAHEVTFVHHAV